MVDNIFFSQFICYSAITVTTFAFIINSANFRLYFCVFVRFWIIKLFAVIVVGAARYFGISMSRPTLCSCLSSHITCAFSLAVPSRQPRYSIFLSMHFLHEVAALRQLNPLLPFCQVLAFCLSVFHRLHRLCHVVQHRILLFLLQGRFFPKRLLCYVAHQTVLPLLFNSVFPYA